MKRNRHKCCICGFKGEKYYMTKKDQARHGHFWVCKFGNCEKKYKK